MSDEFEEIDDAGGAEVSQAAEAPLRRPSRAAARQRRKARSRRRMAGAVVVIVGLAVFAIGAYQRWGATVPVEPVVQDDVVVRSTTTTTVAGYPEVDVTTTSPAAVGMDSTSTVLIPAAPATAAEPSAGGARGTTSLPEPTVAPVDR